MHILLLVTDSNPSGISQMEENDLRSNSIKVWDRAGNELTTPGSAVRLAMEPSHI